MARDRRPTLDDLRRQLAEIRREHPDFADWIDRIEAAMCATCPGLDDLEVGLAVITVLLAEAEAMIESNPGLTQVQ